MEEIIASYHNHSTWSDGASTISEMIAGAQAAGVGEIGISDHYVLCPDGAPVVWSMALDQLDHYVIAVCEAAQEARIPVRLGLEADFFPETIDELRRRLAQYPFDYIIGGCHLVDGFPVDENASFWERLSPDERNAMSQRYWQRVKEMAESRVFDIAAHIDLLKKFGNWASVDLTTEMHAALDAIATAEMAIEINTAGWSKAAREAYPSLELLVEARQRGIPLAINADAHHADDVARDFSRARELARQAGYTSLVRYHARKRYAIPL